MLLKIVHADKTLSLRHVTSVRFGRKPSLQHFVDIDRSSAQGERVLLEAGDTAYIYADNGKEIESIAADNKAADAALDARRAAAAPIGRIAGIGYPSADPSGLRPRDYLGSAGDARPEPVYRTSGRWGVGTGAPLTNSQVDQTLWAIISRLNKLLNRARG